ncbi:MAG: hypothetical protein H0A76_13225 [Candidatus Thiodubiliella endoseptemdiera]|uniref:Uncharacterized protein n=1 Tax=Candidatus Thiodubiliella endoseptemdiera TaxID=2738886 RepID=A0A853F5D8_9GAMM|nr:hypothetical protein [Candidatus Thiodubiliella endoseptemdiera]
MLKTRAFLCGAFKKLIQGTKTTSYPGLEKLKENYQSDERFTNEFIQMRFNQRANKLKLLWIYDNRHRTF